MLSSAKRQRIIWPAYLAMTLSIKPASIDAVAHMEHHVHVCRWVQSSWRATIQVPS